MKKVELWVIKAINLYGEKKTLFVHPSIDWRGKGYGIPMDINRSGKIVSSELVLCDVLEAGDNIAVDIKVDTRCDDDGIESGGRWEEFNGVVSKVYEGGIHNGLAGLIKGAGGRIVTASLIVGDENGYPVRNTRAG